MKSDLFTKQRERLEAEQGLISKDALRQELQSDVDAFLANGGQITVLETEPTVMEKRMERIAKKNKLSAKEIDRRLKEFAKTGQVTL